MLKKGGKPKIDTSWMTIGKPIWIEVPQKDDIFVAGKIVQYDQKIVNYEDEQQKQGSIDVYQVYERGEPGDFDDMVDMEIINDAELLVNLKKRYAQHLIFTYVGPTLLVINPFQACPNLINEQIKEKYIAQVLNKEHRGTQPPHIYAIGAEALKCLFDNMKNQSIIISGESGAGKTENAKLCMNLITSVKYDRHRVDSNSSNKIAIEDRILSCNPILEAFGNAKTIRNNNSSRFGKYTKIYICKNDRKIKGSQIYNYLLEKSRICLQGKGERNFHIFYHILKGMPIQELEQLYLAENGIATPIQQIQYVNTIQDVDGINDKGLFEEVVHSYEQLGLENDKLSIHQIVAAVLHMGDIQFDGSTLTDDTPCKIISIKKLEFVSNLLQLSTIQISEALTLKQRTINKQKISSPVSLQTCYQNRDSWAKELYERLFNWLVQKLNQNIVPSEVYNTYIGLLDIYGFEVFDVNGFEQIMINYTNERLHQLYIQYVFKGEEIVFKEEGLGQYCEHIRYTDNQQLIDCLDKPPVGIFDQLDEVCQVGGDDELFVQKIRKVQKDPKFVQQPKMPTTQSFIIVHTAKNVEYSVKGFKEKNMDEISVLTAHYSEQSGNQLVAQLFKIEQIQTTTIGRKDKSLSKKIRTQMNDLMKELTSNCDAHFVRCIKPNDVKKPNLLEQNYALQQIRYLGVLDSLKVRKQNYPFRRLHRQFYKQFGEITNNPLFEVLDEQKVNFRELNIQLSKEYFPQLGPELILFGNNRIFIRIEGMNVITEVFQTVMKKKNNIALKLQFSWHKYLINKNLKRIHSHVQKIKLVNCSKVLKAIQTTYYYQLRQQKMQLYEKELEKIIQYVYRIQAMTQFNQIISTIKFIQRKIKQWLFFKRIRKLIICKYNLQNIYDIVWNQIRINKSLVIQSFFRGQRVRRVHKNIVIKSKQAGLNKRYEIAATKIQKWIKGYQVRQYIKKQNIAAFKLQGFIKMKWLSQTLKQIRQNTPKIQRLIRRYLIKQRAKAIKKNEYFIPLQNQFQQLIQQEEKDFCGTGNITFDNILQQNKDPFREKGILMDIIIDVEILCDNESYRQTFCSNYKQLFQQSYQNENILQSIKVGSDHSLVATSKNKIYTFGKNEEGQQGKKPDENIYLPNQLNINLQIDQIECSDFNSYAKCIDGKLIIWGSGCQEMSFIDIEPIKNIICKFNNTYVILKNGQILYWNDSHIVKELNFKGIVIQISLGLNFIVILNNQGQVYVKGSNDHGQLGLGDQKDRNDLCLLNITQKVKLISCGLKHLVLQCQNKKAFVCGWNQFGQLGLGDFNDRQILCQIKQFVEQIYCSRTSTIIINENRILMWCGSNGYLKYTNEFIPYKRFIQINNNIQKLNPVRISTTYSKTISLITVTYLQSDEQLLKQPEKLKGVLNLLTSKWIENNINSIDPPLIESVANLLMHFHMKKSTQLGTQLSLIKQCKK